MLLKWSKILIVTPKYRLISGKIVTGELRERQPAVFGETRRKLKHLYGGQVNRWKDAIFQEFGTCSQSLFYARLFLINFLFTCKKIFVTTSDIVDSEFLLEEVIYNALIDRILNTNIYTYHRFVSRT